MPAVTRIRHPDPMNPSPVHSLGYLFLHRRSPFLRAEIRPVALVIQNPQLPLQSPRPFIGSNVRAMTVFIAYRIPLLHPGRPSPPLSRRPRPWVTAGRQRQECNGSQKLHKPAGFASSPRCLRIQTANNPTSAGVTPLIREAWPSVVGRNCANFCLDSLRSPGITM